MKQALHLNLAQAIKLMLITLLCLPIWSTAVQAQEAEPYAVFADGVLTFKYDAAKPAGAYGMNRILVDDVLLPEWYVVGENFKKVVFDNSFALRDQQIVRVGFLTSQISLSLKALRI